MTRMMIKMTATRRIMMLLLIQLTFVITISGQKTQVREWFLICLIGQLHTSTWVKILFLQIMYQKSSKTVRKWEWFLKSQMKLIVNNKCDFIDTWDVQDVNKMTAIIEMKELIILLESDNDLLIWEFSKIVNLGNN